MGKTNLPNLQRHFFCVFYIMIGKCNVIGEIAHGLYWRQKILYFTKKILPLDLCSQKSKKRRFLKKPARKILFVEILFLCVGQRKYLFAAESCS